MGGAALTRSWRIGAVAVLLLSVVMVPVGRATAEGQTRRPVFDPRSLPSPSGTDVYVCRVTWELPGPAPHAGGRFGAIYIEFAKQPNCEGVFGSARFYSEGAISGFFDPRYAVSEPMLQTLLLMLQRAAGTGQRVNWTTCEENNYSCLRALVIVGTDTVR